MNKYRPILLVEDDEQDQILCQEAIHESKVSNPVVTVRDGVEALDYLFSRNEYQDKAIIDPAVVLLDIKLPRKTGIEVLIEIRKHEKLAQLPVVMLTSSRNDYDLSTCYSEGANAYVVKPVDFKDYMHTVGIVSQFWGIINEPPIQGDNIPPTRTPTFR